MGNAAFHSSYLYPLLVNVVPSLCTALNDSDEKTRANAAGALGNLVRNGGSLSTELVRHSVPEKLILMALQDTSVQPQVRVELFTSS